MDVGEARVIARRVLAEYRARSYSELRAFIGSSDHREVPGASAAVYQVDVQALWDDATSRNTRVLASIDDGGLRAFRPVCEDFIMAPDGRFIGE